MKKKEKIQAWKGSEVLNIISIAANVGLLVESYPGRREMITTQCSGDADVRLVLEDPVSAHH